MDNVEYYYIEIRPNPTEEKTHDVIVLRSDLPLSFLSIPSDKQYAEWAYGIYRAYCNSKQFYNCALRMVRRWKNDIMFHGLIAECFSDSSVPLWYDNCSDFKRFAADLQFDPSERSFS